jgi:hypothetical protein
MAFDDILALKTHDTLLSRSGVVGFITDLITKENGSTL